MGTKTNNLPPRYQTMVVEAVRLCEEKRAESGKDDATVRKEIKAALIEMITDTAADKAAHIPSYMGTGLNRVVKYAMDYVKDNRPTHRKGFGEAGVEEIQSDAPIIFRFGGTSSGTLPPGSDSGLPDEDPFDEDDDGEMFDGVPSSEEARARSALSEVGIGRGEAPLPFVRKVARLLGGNWGLNGKRGNPNDPSGDILAYRFEGYQPQLFDVLIDGGGKNTITWRQLPYPQSSGAVWLEP